MWGGPSTLIFIGGGTPSLSRRIALAADRRLRAMLPFEPQCEITMEANPAFEKDRFRVPLGQA